VAILVARMALLEGPPVIAEDLLEGVFVDPLSLCAMGDGYTTPCHSGPPAYLTALCPALVSGEGDTGQHKKEILIR